jgi:hypothetical protein
MAQLQKQKVHGPTQELMDATIAVTLATQVKKWPSLSEREHFSVPTVLKTKPPRIIPGGL